MSAANIISVDSLKPGHILAAPIHATDSGTLLIAAGIPVTTAHLQNLRERKIDSVRVSAADARAMGGGNHETKTDAAPKGEPPPQPFLIKPFSIKSPRPSAAKTASFGKQFNASVTEVKNLFANVAARGEISTDAVMRTAERQMQDMSDDFQLYLALGLRPDADRYPYSHSLQTSRLAMAIGAVLEFPERALAEIGVGCLLHDIGMVKLDPELLQRARPFDALEKLSVERHPAIACDLLQQVGGISEGSRMVIYQMHERLDGSGYPRKRTALQIHAWSKIAMVADVFIAMTSPRPQCAALQPYYAMVELLELTKQGKFDPKAVRALLETVSLFPLGSFVELSDGRIAKVVAANGSHIDRPIVDVVAPDGTPNETPDIIDLVATSELSIIRPALDPGLQNSLRKQLAISC